MTNTYVVIMAGGIGSRFWPISKSNHPKQFLDILGMGQTLLQMTYERFLGICPADNIFITTNQKHANLVLEQLPDLKKKNLLIEPSRKNTAAAILYATYKIKSLDSEARMIITPSDHIIQDMDLFNETLFFASDYVAQKDCLLSLGIKPHKASSNYTYIQFKEDEDPKNNVFNVKTFAEQPTKEIAKTFYKSGDFLWHTSIMIWQVSAILKAYEKFLPDLYNLFQEGEKKFNTWRERRFVEKIYPICENASIKNGILYKAENNKVLLGKFRWSNLNTWESLWENKEKDYVENAVNGNNVVMYNANNCMVHVPNEKLVIIQGLDNYIIADSENALLICKRKEEHHLKNITDIIKRKQGDKFL